MQSQKKTNFKKMEKTFDVFLATFQNLSNNFEYLSRTYFRGNRSHERTYRIIEQLEEIRDKRTFLVCQIEFNNRIY